MFVLIEGAELVMQEWCVSVSSLCTNQAVFCQWRTSVPRARMQAKPQQIRTYTAGMNGRTVVTGNKQSRHQPHNTSTDGHRVT